MNKIYNTYRLKVMAIMLIIGFSACEKEVLLPGAERLFRPIIKEQIVGGTWFQMKWDKFKGAVAFELEVSVDTFKTIYRSVRTDSTQFTFRNLEFDTHYQIRLRSVGDSLLANGDTIRSAFNIFNIRTLDFPTLLQSPTRSDVLDNSIRVKWTVSNLVYNRIDVIVSKDSLLKSVTVTAAENLAGEKIITGLMPTSTYIVKIFAGDEYKGKKTFRTIASQLFEGAVIDLRNLSDDEALDRITQHFIDSLGTIHTDGFNLILAGGTLYKIPTINIPVSLNMVTGLSFKGKAIAAVNGSFGIKASTNVGHVKFDKIFFTEGTDAGRRKTDAHFGGTYIFNMNQSNGNVGEIVIENCDVKYKRGGIRIQTAGKIDHLTINNCIFDSIGGFGIVNIDHANAMITDLVLKNSTFVHFDGFLCRNIRSVVSPNSIVIENITTCFAPAPGRYFLEVQDRNYPGGITIKNSIFGSVLVPGSTVHGLRSTASKITIENCFKTSDLVWTIAVGATTPTFPINCEELGKTSAEIFADPANRNFRVTNPLLVKKAGDPRWW